MSTTEFKASNNPPRHYNGISYAQKKTLLTMHRDHDLHPSLHRVIGSWDLHSCISHLQRQHELMKCSSSLNRKKTQRFRPQVRSCTCRLKFSHLTSREKNPVILAKDSHIALLLVRHHHEQVRHQGRHLIEDAVRAAGLWILGAKQLIN